MHATPPETVPSTPSDSAPAATPVIAVVGATGAVGREVLSILETRQGPFARSTVQAFASARSAGRRLPFRAGEITLAEMDDHSFDGVDVAIFAADGETARSWTPRARAAGCTVIDNSSAFRMDPEATLVVPEVNGDLLDAIRTTRAESPAIIANPNCSTIIALVALTPLHRAAGVRRIVAATYQAASGAGAAAMAELERQAREFANDQPITREVFATQALFNVFSHDSPIAEDGQNEEERKIVRETARIWERDDIGVIATCVRVPVLRAHAEAIHVEFDRPIDEEEARELLSTAPGVRVVDDRAANRFPEPLDAAGGDDVLVGRIRRDPSDPDGRGLALFVCGDQLRKGAALNAIQIAERVV